ncbi:MAG TPA: amidohydrolase family protein [Thermomicrobiales bacterium]|nr:amidohydrolase family protein [Thermomicrobiales bacterium]
MSQPTGRPPWASPTNVDDDSPPLPQGEGAGGRGSIFIQNVRPLNGDPIDLRIADGLIAEAGPNLPHGPDEVIIDGGGRLLFPSFVDAHAHMDKTLLGMGWHRNEVGPSLLDKIENERAVRRERDIDYHEQTLRQARLAIAVGTTHIRTFVDIDTEHGLAGFEGVMRTREEMRDALDIQVVAFPQSGMLARPGTVELLERALEEGAHVIGGLDPSTIDRDPKGHLDAIFGMAERFDVDVDIHLHEPGELGAFSVELIAERTRVLGWQGRVVISHAFCLGGVDDAHYGRLVDLLLENDIAIMSHGPSGSVPIPPLKRLREAGVRMCTGNDGIRDAWGPLNMPDMLLRTFLVAYRNNLRRDDEIELVLDIATHGGARVIGAQVYGLRPGCAADFVLVDGETHVEAVIERPARWLVVKRGRIVAREGTCLL